MSISEYKEWKFNSRRDFLSLFDKFSYQDGAEIGVWEADYSIAILENTSVKTIHLVDPWTAIGMTRTKITGEEAFQNAKKKLNYYEGRFVLHRGLSKDIYLEFKDESLDFVYIDANHDYEHTTQDLEFWFPKIKKGGLMFGHDYNNRNYKRVKKAVDNFFGEKNVNSTNERVRNWFVGKL